MDNEQRKNLREDGTEIDLVQMLVEILKNIRPILICAVICGILLSGTKYALRLYGAHQAKSETAETTVSLNKYGVGNTVGLSGSAEETAEYKTKAERDYEQKLETYQLQVASYQNQLSQVLKRIARNEEYKRGSILLNMDPNNFYQKDAVWYVDTHYQVDPNLSMQNPNPVGSIMDAYETFLSSEDFYGCISEATTDQIDVTYLRELIFAKTDGQTGFIRLTVLAPTETMANEIFSAVVDYFNRQKRQISDTVGSYDISLIDKWGYESSAVSGSGPEDAFAESTIGAGYTNFIKRRQDSFNSTLAELQTSAVELRQKLAALAEPKAPGTDGSLKTVVKNAIVGGVLGFVAAIFYIAIRFIARDAALSENQLRRRYGLFVLASVKRFPGKGGWQRMLSRMSGDARRSADVAEAAGLAQATLASLLEAEGQKGGKVLLVGKDADALSQIGGLIADKRQNGVATGGDVMTDKAVVETLRDYENVVLVERKEETSYREIGRELEKLSLLGKKVVGLIAL